MSSATGQTQSLRKTLAADGKPFQDGHRQRLSAGCTAQSQVCNLFPRRGHKNDYILHKDVHSISSL